MKTIKYRYLLLASALCISALAFLACPNGTIPLSPGTEAERLVTRLNKDFGSNTAVIDPVTKTIVHIVNPININSTTIKTASYYSIILAQGVTLRSTGTHSIKVDKKVLNFEGAGTVAATVSNNILVTDHASSLINFKPGITLYLEKPNSIQKAGANGTVTLYDGAILEAATDLSGIPPVISIEKDSLQLIVRAGQTFKTITPLIAKTIKLDGEMVITDLNHALTIKSLLDITTGSLKAENILTSIILEPNAKLNGVMISVDGSSGAVQKITNAVWNINDTESSTLSGSIDESLVISGMAAQNSANGGGRFTAQKQVTLTSTKALNLLLPLRHN